MNDHSYQILDYYGFLELLSGYASSEPGQAALRALRPSTDPDAVDPANVLYRDCLAVRRENVHLPAAHFDSPLALLRRAAPADAALDADAFFELRRAFDTVVAIRRFLAREECEGAESLKALGERLDECAELSAAVERTFDETDGRVRDNASVRLRQIRVKMSSIEGKIRSTLDRILGDPDYGEALQDSYFTTRHGRYVVPVRRELRGRVKGVAHDQSASGRTLFMEPEATLEMGNALEEHRLDEINEIRRILSGLTDLVRGQSDVIRRNFEELCHYDIAFAVSGWAQAYECFFPELGERLNLSGARHPLLDRQFREEGREDDLVPLDIDVSPEDGVIVITGSNTGGKTVILETLGLLTMIAQTGLPIPADEGSAVRFFSQVLADIGDEQSIEQSLSTFSGHLQQIVNILEVAGEEGALVLLDELGAGTDPVEGGALGCGILDALSKEKGLTFATTHMGAIKSFVHNRPGMRNASVAFNVRTLQPEYRLLMGQAGASHALTVAERSGVPDDVIQFARGAISSEHLELENMLSSIDEKHRKLEEELDELEGARDAAVKARDDAVGTRNRIGKELGELRKERRRLLHEAQAEASALVSNAKREMEKILAEAKEQPDRDRTRKLRRKIEDREKRLRAGVEQTKAKPAAAGAFKRPDVGERAWIEKLKAHGTILSLTAKGDRATVEVDGMTFEVDAREIGPPLTLAQPSAKPAVTVTTSREHEHVPVELNLVGKRVKPALDELGDYMDSAFLAGLPVVRIIHGYGTGALQEAVHGALKSMPVKSYRLGKEDEDAGGAGITIVNLE